MSILGENPGLLDALRGEMTPKFLATRSADGVPNVVPLTSIMPSGDVGDRLIFGNFLLRKSIGNLDSDPRLSVLVITQDLEGWILQGDFAGWQRTGTYVDRIMNTDLLRYNAYTGFRNAGIIEVSSVVRPVRIPKLRVLADYVLARLGGEPRVDTEATTRMPLPVLEGYRPMTALRVLAFVQGDGYPLAVPVLSLQPAGERALVCTGGPAGDLLAPLQAGSPVAASLLTLDVVSFQAKGTWLGTCRALGVVRGGMAVEAVFAGGPPIPGRQVA
jgi:hypothetical protein